MVPRLCDDCGAEVAPGLMACPGCSRLVHAEELKQLADEALEDEKNERWTEALGKWRRASHLLPPGSRQRAKIEERMSALSATVDGRGEPPRHGARPARSGKKAGAGAAVGAAGVAIAKSKALFALVVGNGKLLLLGLTKLPTLLSMLAFTSLAGGRATGFAFGIAACIYVHEVGHVAALRRYGADVSAPMFVPGFGAFVRSRFYPTGPHEVARVALAGPLWGLVASACAALIGKAAGSAIVVGIGSVSAMINLLNLIPVWMLDGGRGVVALSRAERLILAAVAGATAAVTHQWMAGLVALATLVAALRPSDNPEGDPGAFRLYTGLVVALAAVGSLRGSVPW
jgi:Zn-dependent protease